MIPVNDLSIELRDQIDAKFFAAFAALGSAQHKADIGLANRLAQEGWGLLPEPKYSWDVSLGYVLMLGKIYRETGLFSLGIRLMEDFVQSGFWLPHQDGPYLLLGTIFYEMGDRERAYQSLLVANRISKGRCFKKEIKKYENFFKEYGKGAT